MSNTVWVCPQYDIKATVDAVMHISIEADSEADAKAKAMAASLANTHHSDRGECRAFGFLEYAVTAYKPLEIEKVLKAAAMTDGQGYRVFLKAQYEIECENMFEWSNQDGALPPKYAISRVRDFSPWLELKDGEIEVWEQSTAITSVVGRLRKRSYTIPQEDWLTDFADE